MKKLSICFVILQLSFSNLKSQNLEGIWNGYSEKKLSIANPENIRLELSQTNDTLYNGVLHLTYKKKMYEHIKVSAKVNKTDSTLFLVEDSLISFKKHFMDEICLGSSLLKTYKTDTSIIMKGVWKDKKKGLFKCPNLKISYEKMNNIKLVKNEREEDIQMVLDISKKISDSIKVEIFDNGSIDGDSISLYLNETLLVQKLKLKETPFIKYINLNKNIEFNKLILIAENLGEIPPNTAYMIITTKKNVYRINLSSTLSKNGTIEFQFID